MMANDCDEKILSLQKNERRDVDCALRENGKIGESLMDKTTMTFPVGNRC